MLVKLSARTGKQSVSPVRPTKVSEDNLNSVPFDGLITEIVPLIGVQGKALLAPTIKNSCGTGLSVKLTVEELPGLPKSLKQTS